MGANSCCFTSENIREEALNQRNPAQYGPLDMDFDEIVFLGLRGNMVTAEFSGDFHRVFGMNP